MIEFLLGTCVALLLLLLSALVFVMKRLDRLENQTITPEMEMGLRGGMQQQVVESGRE